MVDLYLDASVLVSLVVEEPFSRVAVGFVSQHAGHVLTSEFAAAEAASGVSRLVRMGKLSAVAGTAALEDFDIWRLSTTEQVETVPADVRLAHMLVRRFETKLRAPDALHIAMAKRLGATLVTRDAGMRAAADLVGVVAVEPV